MKVINVEYNQLDALLRENGGGGDTADESGYSPYPGNINILIFEVRSRRYLGHISATSRPQIGYISARSRPYLTVEVRAYESIHYASIAHTHTQ